MLDFATPHSAYEPVGENRGRFIVEPLARGFGYTFGNALRRVLLSSLEGAAISSVKISGVEHEFSTVAHVKEDVTDIILNLKKIVVRLEGDEPKTMRIDRNTFTFSSRMASASNCEGASMAESVISCSKWFWNMSRRMPTES